MRRADGSCASSGEEGRSEPRRSRNDAYERVLSGCGRDRAGARRRRGWLHTGDVGFDERGWLFLVDRDSNMIKRAGENISAAEVEHAIMGMPQVKEAAVIGVADPVRDVREGVRGAGKPARTSRPTRSAPCAQRPRITRSASSPSSMPFRKTKGGEGRQEALARRIGLFRIDGSARFASRQALRFRIGRRGVSRCAAFAPNPDASDAFMSDIKGKTKVVSPPGSSDR